MTLHTRQCHHPRQLNGAEIGDAPGIVDRAEIASNGDIVGAESEVDPECVQNAATDLVLDRILTEQAEMSEAAPRQNWCTQRQGTTSCQRVEIRRVSRFQLRLATRREGQLTQSVSHKEHHFGAIVFLQPAGEIMRVGHRTAITFKRPLWG